MCPGTSDAHRGGMNELINIPDQIVAQLAGELRTDRTGRIQHRHALKARRRRFERAARLRRLLA